MTLSEYDNNWPNIYANERDRLILALPELLVTIHHIGSTSIPGMISKPIIDILAEIRELGDIDRQVEVLICLGYESMGEHDIEGRRYFRKLAPDFSHQFHLHIFQIGSVAGLQMLWFKQKLLSRPDISAEYASLKTKLAHKWQFDKNEYQTKKSQFIVDVLDNS